MGHSHIDTMQQPWKLTPEKVQDIVDEHYTSSGPTATGRGWEGVMESDMKAAVEEAAAAAVKKVVEWMEYHNNDFSLALADNGEYERKVLHGGLELVKSDWAAVKKAAFVFQDGGE